MAEGDLLRFYDNDQISSPILQVIADSLDGLRQQVIQEDRLHTTKRQTEVQDTVKLHRIKREDVRRRMEIVIEHVLTSLSMNEAPSIAYNSRTSWQNIRFSDHSGFQMIPNTHATEVRFDSLHSINKFGMTLQVMAMCYKLVQSNTFSTKRDIYYQDTQLFGSQSSLDEIIDNISCMIKVPRECLHVLATSKGLIAGDLYFKEAEDKTVDCTNTQTGIAIPANMNTVSNIRSTATMVLIVEKDAIFQKLLDEKIFQKLPPCIVLTGRGFPDVSTRRMVRKLWNCLKIPIFVLVDADPHGMAILSVYKYGSRGLSFDTEELAVPGIRWLGVLPSDIIKFHVSQESLIPLTTADLDKAREIMKRPSYTSQPLWMKEMQTMLSMNNKAEIEALSGISRSFLTDVYLPTKLASQSWI
ncbi:meiotic recombination protein SPO11-like [Glandiceps talaboti]